MPPVRTVAVAVLALLVLAGCGDDDGGTTAVADGVRPFPEVTAPVPDAGAEPEDGEHAVEILGVDPVAGTLVVNFVAFLTGDGAAEAFEAETGGEAGIDGPPNDYWIVDEVDDEHPLVVDDDAVIRVVTAGDVTSEPTDLAGLAERVGTGGPFWVRIDDGEVVSIQEQFVP